MPPETTASPALYIAVAVGALLVTAVSKGGFGGGVGSFSVPLMLQVAPATFVVGLWLPILIACDVATIGHYPREWKPRAFAKLAPGMIIGIVATSFLLRMLAGDAGSGQKQLFDAWLKLGVAGIALLFLGLRKVQHARRADTPWAPTWPVSLPVGLASGVTSTLAHAAGPMLTMYLLAQRLEKRVFVGTTGRMYFIFNSVKVVFLIWIAGVLTLDTFKYGIWLMVLAPFGVRLGSWLNRKVSEKWFVRLIHIFLVVVAGKLIYDGIGELVFGAS